MPDRIGINPGGFNHHLLEKLLTTGMPKPLFQPTPTYYHSLGRGVVHMAALGLIQVTVTPEGYKALSLLKIGKSYRKGKPNETT